MNKYKIVTEALSQPIESVPRCMRKTMMRPEVVDICPHCKKEIGEKESFSDDDGKTYVHGPCKGRYRSSEQAEKEAKEFLKGKI